MLKIEAMHEIIKENPSRVAISIDFSVRLGYVNLHIWPFQTNINDVVVPTSLQYFLLSGHLKQLSNRKVEKFNTLYCIGMLISFWTV